MFGDERASAKEINLFLMRLQGQGSAVSETTKLETHVRMCSHSTSDFCKPHHYWVSSPTSNFSTIGLSVLEIRRWGVHVRTCRGAQLMTCVKHLSNDSKATPNLIIIGRAVPEIPTEARCARAHVQRYPTRDYCISCNQWVTKCIANFNAIGPTVTE